MLVSKEVEIHLTSANILYYENLGYKIPRKKDSHYRYTVPKDSVILVKVNDLPKGSSATEIDVQCDYCGKYFKKKYSKYIQQQENSITKKDCCDECKQLKTKESVLLKYGVERNTQIPEVKDKMSEARRLDIEIVRKAFMANNLTIVESMFNYINDRSLIYFICNKHPEEGIQNTYYMILQQGGCGCKKCRYEKITGENCHLWKGGITNLSNFLRGKIREWKFNSLKKYNFKCALTNLNDNSLVIHHLYSFSKILEEVIENTNVPIYEDVSLYSEDELNILINECVRLHNKYGVGIPVLKCLHNIFHAQIGNLIIDNGEFELFSKKYYNFEFDYLLNDKYKYCNILKAVS